MSQPERFDLRRVLRRWGWLPLVVGLILVADQISKAWIERSLPLSGGYAPFPAFDPYFMLVNWGNTGTAFGLLQGMGGIFALVALVVIVFVLVFSQQLPIDNWGVRLCVGLVLGGAIGNQIDRLRVGHVTDFLLFQAPLGDHMLQWPAWNVADASIVVGVILLALLLLRTEGKKTDSGS